MKLDIKIGITAFVLFSVTILPIAYFHELGHKVICEEYGGQAKVSAPNDFGIDAICLHSKAPVELMRLFGGIFGGVLALSPLIGYRYLKDNTIYRAVLVACLPQAVGEFPKAILEAFYYDFYASEFSSKMFLVIVVISAAGFFLLLGRVKGQKLAKV